MAPDDLENLTPEQRERLEKAEQAALDILKTKMHDGGWYPRRHMLVAFYVLFGIAALYFVILGVGWLVSHV
ncbi:MAG TPA: hypothetical protein VNI20_02620 [Fimbriimonadaceae bacterium]|nr:hypothetical protein [Fimbriimonadaceae bacterium]